MTELLASNIDINGWLPGDKLEANTPNTAQFQIDAWRLIRGQLASSFTPVILASWASPTSTPDIVRGIAARLIAAYLYRQVYSEDSTDIPSYAQTLYNEAIGMLADIRSGALVLVDPITAIPITGAVGTLDQADFLTTVPVFTMDQVFG